MSNQSNTPDTTSEDSGTPRVSTTSSGQDDTSQDAAAAQKAPQPAQDQSTSATTSTQSNMGNGDGIRGEYGDASQTNGMEGGSKDEADSGQNAS